jgi:glycosyltransferase involved in cell wall biosynthesis
VKPSAEDILLKIALIGSLPPPIGGTSVSFENLVTFMKRHDGVETLVVDTSGVRAAGIKAPLRYLALLFALLKSVSRADVVSLHVCTSALPSFGLLVLGICRMFRKPVIIRKFGGTDYLDKGGLVRKLSHFVVQRSNLYLAQTKQLVRRAKENGVSHVKWFPTSRYMPVESRNSAEDRNRCRKFVYLGQIRTVKGIIEIIRAGERFYDAEDVAIDVYGTLDFDVAPEFFRDLKKVRYCGILKPDQVMQTLKRYDVLLLPSFHPGEGYPGVVLEAYGAGLPVICTRWRALPEIVDETTGILIEPKNAESLYLAMKRLIEDNAFYVRLKEGVADRRSFFSAEYWGQYFVELCRTTAKDSKKLPGKFL